MDELDLKYMNDINYWLGKLSMVHEFMDQAANSKLQWSKQKYAEYKKHREEIMKHITRLSSTNVRLGA